MVSYKFFVLSALSMLATAMPIEDAPIESRDRHPVKQLYQFGKGSWLENLAVRANGNILANRLDVPELYEFAAPDYSTARLVYTFPRATGLSGIAETKPDVFAVLAGNFSLQTSQTVPGSWSLWTLDFNGASSATSVAAHNVANLTQLGLANGIAYLPRGDRGAGSVLVSDSVPGGVWRVDLAGGATELVIQDRLMAAQPTEGINGLKIFTDARTGRTLLYFDNSNTGSVDSIPVDPETGRSAGRARKIATVDPASYPNRDFNDDLAPSRDGRFLYVTGGTGNTVIRFDVASGAQTIIAGSINSTEIAEPTAVAFGRRKEDRNVLYAVGGGGQGAPIGGKAVVGAQLVAIDLDRKL